MMKNRISSTLRLILVLLGVSVGLFVCISFAYVVLKVAFTPVEQITLEEAQSRTAFAICTPTYLPKNISPEPEVHADFSDPAEVEIKLLFKAYDNSEVLVEIDQTQSSNVRLPDLLGDNKEYFSRALIAWVVGWTNVDSYRNQVEVSASTYKENSLEYGVYEIISPSKMQAKMVVWKKDYVLYQLFAHLPYLELQEIARSLTDCGNFPMPIPQD